MSADAPMIVTRYVRARMEPIFRIEKTKNQIGTRKVLKRKGLVGKRVEVEEPVFEEIRHETGDFSDVRVDYQQLTEMLEQVCEEMERAGYNVISITPINEGNYRYKSDSNASSTLAWAWGYGYSLTRGAVIVGRRAAAN